MVNRLIRPLRRLHAHLPESVRASIYCCLFVGAITLLITYDEFSDIGGLRFLLLKGGISLFYFVCAFTLFKWPDSGWNGLFFISVATLCSIVGSHYRSLYIIGLFDTFVCYIFLFRMTSGDFWISVLASFGLYTAYLIARFPNIPENHAPMTLDDHVFISVQRVVVLIFVFYFFIRAKNYQLAAEKRFSLLGRQAARVAHDLKGTLAGPLLVMDLATEQESGPQFAALGIQMRRVHESLAELSRLCSLEQLPATRFSLSDAIKGAELLYFKNFHDIALEVEGDVNFQCDRSLITSVLTNLFSNTITAFRSNGIRERKISLTVEDIDPVQIVYRDNAGGFSAQALATIARHEPYSTSGNGIGIQLVKDCLERLHGTATFENENGGAKITLSFTRQSPLTQI